MSEELKALARGRADFYKTGGQGLLTGMMLNEAKGQYIDMANGGNGSCVGNGEIREHYYPGKPDAFFQLVCDLVGWEWELSFM